LEANLRAGGEGFSGTGHGMAVPVFILGHGPGEAGHRKRLRHDGNR
jgi:hypothetical protein